MCYLSMSIKLASSILIRLGNYKKVLLHDNAKSSDKAFPGTVSFVFIWDSNWGTLPHVTKPVSARFALLSHVSTRCFWQPSTGVFVIVIHYWLLKKTPHLSYFNFWLCKIFELKLRKTCQKVLLYNSIVSKMEFLTLLR